MLEFDQNILSQYPLKKKHLLISKQQEDKKNMFCSRMRCDPKTNAEGQKSITK